MHKCKILTTSNGKGGTGKTTLNTFIAETLFARGNNILLIDLDHNCCLPEMYGFELQEETSKDFTAWDLNCRYIISHSKSHNELEKVFKRKNRRKIRKELKIYVTN